MAAEIPTSVLRNRACPPPIESIAEWTIGSAEFARVLLRGDRVGSQGWPLITGLPGRRLNVAIVAIVAGAAKSVSVVG